MAEYVDVVEKAGGMIAPHNNTMNESGSN